jgi:hypothetical protein
MSEFLKENTDQEFVDKVREIVQYEKDTRLSKLATTGSYSSIVDAVQMNTSAINGFTVPAVSGNAGIGTLNRISNVVLFVGSSPVAPNYTLPVGYRPTETVYSVMPSTTYNYDELIYEMHVDPSGKLTMDGIYNNTTKQSVGDQGFLGRFNFIYRTTDEAPS